MHSALHRRAMLRAIEMLAKALDKKTLGSCTCTRLSKTVGGFDPFGDKP